MKRIFSILFALALLIALAVPTLGAELAIDWDSMDWETFDWDIMNTPGVTASWSNWMDNTATLSQIFEVSRNCHHTALSAGIHEDFYPIFAKAPEKFLTALSYEEKEFQLEILDDIAFGMEITLNNEECVRVLESIRLNGETQPEEVALMLKLIEMTEERLGVSITVPPTGDPIPAAVLGLLCATAGGILLHKREWTFRRNEK